MAAPTLNKKLYTDITRLKLLDTNTAEVRFRLQTSPFTGDEDTDELATQKREDYIITGQVFPNSDIYRERSFLIELKLTKNFPADPPEVKFLTPIYHPNVGLKGKSKKRLFDGEIGIYF
jgi:ubiquitin-protein ligase